MNLKVDTRFKTWAHSQDKKEALKTKQAQALPLHLTLESEMAKNIAKTQQGKTQEVQEDISLFIGGRLREARGRRTEPVEEKRRDIQSIKQLAKGTYSVELSQLLATFGDNDAGISELLNLVRSGGIATGMSLLLLGSLLNRKSLSPKLKKILEDTLSELLESESEWPVSLFASLSTSDLSAGSLVAIKTIYQRTYSEDDKQRSVSELFEEMKDWKDRREKIRILLRSLALDLAPSAESNIEIRIANAINQLRRLLQFLVIEDHAFYVGGVLNMDGNRILEEVLVILQQNWFYPEWFQQRITLLGVNRTAFIWLRRLEELMRLLPLGCYKDEEQREQLSEALTLLITSLDDEEE